MSANPWASARCRIKSLGTKGKSLGGKFGYYCSCAYLSTMLYGHTHILTPTSWVNGVLVQPGRKGHSMAHMYNPQHHYCIEKPNEQSPSNPQSASNRRLRRSTSPLLLPLPIAHRGLVAAYFNGFSKLFSHLQFGYCASFLWELGRLTLPVFLTSEHSGRIRPIPQPVRFTA